VEEIRRRFLVNLLKTFDLGLMALSFGITTIIVAYSGHQVSVAEFFSIRVKVSNCLIFALLLFFWHVVFYASGLYRSRRLAIKGRGLVDAAKAIAVSTACLAICARLVPINMVTAPFLMIFWAVGTAAVGVSRVVLRQTLDQTLRRGRNFHYMLIIGTNSRAIEFAKEIEAEPERGYRVLGFVDDDWPRVSEAKRSGFRLVCHCANLPEFLRRNVVDEVAMYLPLRTFYERASQIARLCEQHGIIVRFDGDIFSLKRSRSRREEFEGQVYVTTISTLQWWPMVIKRMLDIAFSSILLLLLAPLFAVVALLIHVTSEGPIFYLQERVGVNKRRFRVFKFRTMIPNAEKMIDQLEKLNEVSGPVFKIKNDPRITPIGRILRRTSIDELPQLLNVLKGDMSLVGPRPLPVRDYEGFSEDWQRRRFSVRPGITCLWQINGRSSTSFDQWMNLDLQYMEEWSLWLDFKILLMTIPAVLKGTGAA
jgi:exopolysaccharide biosynthesis polyprenyl glycosylphosphotransferase